MAFALRQPIRAHSPTSGSDSARASSVCRVHTCIRCKSTVESNEPCSFVPSIVQVCPRCAGQEQALAHLPASRTPWGSVLARTRRA